jgi:hypothetical protein
MEKPINRIMILLSLLAIVICSSVSALMASTLSGVVLDNKTNAPISGVRVSVGFTDTVTYTDKNGNFSFTGNSGTIRNVSTTFSETFFMKRTARGTSIDLSNCRSITDIRLFDLSGKCLFRTAESSLYNDRILIPYMPGGMYIIQVLTNTGTAYALRWNSQNGSQSANIATHIDHNRRAAAAPTGNKKIEFRHDSYYPIRIVDSGTVVTVKMKSDPRGELFDQKKIGRYDFILTKEDSLSMEKNALLEEYIPADFSYNNIAFGKVGIRYKGSTYSLPNCFESDGIRSNKPECHKISFKVKFDNYIDSLRFYKMKKLNLHSESIDGSKMHDILGYELFREMGITAPRCSFAKVYLNGVFQGLFCAVEDIDGRFADSRWPEDGNGNLYKEKWPISKSPSYYKGGLITNDKPEDSADVSTMVAFCKALEMADASSFAQSVSPFFDFDYWLHYIAADRVIHNADGVMTWYAQPDWFSNHNYFLYQPKAAGEKMWIIPWDLHVTFGRKDPIVDAMGVPEWNVVPESCEPDSILWGNQLGVPAHCDKLTGLTADVYWNDFVKISEKMLKTCFDVKYLQGKIDFYKNLIDTVIQKDPYVDHDTWSEQVSSLRNDVVVLNNDFNDYIHKRTVAEDTSGYTLPFEGNGYLVSNRINNFEFTPLGNEKTWSYYYVSENSSITVKHDTIQPLWGKGDVRYSFVYNPAPGEGQYIEWGRIFMKFEKVTDLSGLKEIRVNLKSDSNRDLWLFIASNQYTKNCVSTEYGWWDATSSKGTMKVFSLNSIGYPSWATGDLPNILSDVLTNATGIGFSSNPHYNSSGKLASVPDSGYLRIDNIRLVF